MLPTFSEAILARLPDASRAKAIALDNARQAAHAALTAATSRLADAYRRRDLLAEEIDQKIENMPGGNRYQDEVAALRAPLKIVDAEVDQLKAEVGRSEREFATFDCIERAAKWLAEPAQLSRSLKHQPGSKIKAGVDHRVLVEKVRSRIDDLAEQIEAVELAPAPADDLRNRIATEVDRLAEAGRPIIDHRDPDSIAGAIYRAAKVDAFSIWLNRDALVKKLTAEVIDAPNAMSEAAKRNALADLAAKLLEAEREEETLIVAAHAVGTAINRRRAADPGALLEIA